MSEMIRAPVVVFFVLLAVSFVLVFSTNSTVLSGLAGSIQNIFSGPVNFARNLLPVTPSASDFDRLARENRALISKSFESEELRRENEELRSQIRESDDEISNYIIGSVVGKVGSIDRPKTLLVEFKQGNVDVGMAVVEGKSLVGRVERVIGNLARVMTLHDERFEIVFESGRTDAKGKISGGVQEVEFSDVPVEDVIARGDLLLTAGIISDDDEVFIPRSLLIGKVNKVKSDPQNPFQSGVVMPSVDYRMLNTVFIWSI